MNDEPDLDLAAEDLDRPDLDPGDWPAFRALGHRMLDEMIDHLETVRDRPAWQPVPASARARLGTALPAKGTPLATLYGDFRETILPFPTGNAHLGGRAHAPILVERQVIGWCRELFQFPDSTAGLLVTGTSFANLLAIAVARTDRLGAAVRCSGLRDGPRLTAYAARSAHGCVTKAFELLGLGSDSLRLVPTDRTFRIDITALRQAILADRAAGAVPFLVIGTAGTVDTGAIDDLASLADLAAAEDLWLHVDGAFGALAMLSPTLKGRLAGIERADSLAFDFHKWAHVPYDAACVLVREGDLMRATFATEPPYLARYERGAGAGAPWFADYGIDLSRGFRALKVWFTLREQGSDKLGAAILKNCRQAQALGQAIARASELELMAPVSLNIVCFRH